MKRDFGSFKHILNEDELRKLKRELNKFIKAFNDKKCKEAEWNSSYTFKAGIVGEFAEGPNHTIALTNEDKYIDLKVTTVTYDFDIDPIHFCFEYKCKNYQSVYMVTDISCEDGPVLHNYEDYYSLCKKLIETNL